jgi:hypothetical protein
MDFSGFLWQFHWTRFWTNQLWVTIDWFPQFSTASIKNHRDFSDFLIEIAIKSGWWFQPL